MRNPTSLTVFGLIPLLSVVLSTAGCTHTVAMTMTYSGGGEEIRDPGAIVLVVARDSRTDKEMTEGADSTAGERAVGALLAGPLILLADADIEASEKQDFIATFEQALYQRLSAGGSRTTDRQREAEIVVDLAVTQLALDFGTGSWTGDVGYTAIVRRGGGVLCEKAIHKRVRKFNWNGPRTGQAALNEAFTLAINAFDFDGCVVE